MTIMSILGRKFTDSEVINNAQLQFIAEILMKDYSFPVVRFTIKEDKRLIIVSVFAEENGVEYFIRPKVDPFTNIMNFLQLSYHIRFSRRENNDQL
jgi:hypothetical protein